MVAQHVELHDRRQPLRDDHQPPGESAVLQPVRRSHQLLQDQRQDVERDEPGAIVPRERSQEQSEPADQDERERRGFHRAVHGEVNRVRAESPDDQAEHRDEHHRVQHVRLRVVREDVYRLREQEPEVALLAARRTHADGADERAEGQVERDRLVEHLLREKSPLRRLHEAGGGVLGHQVRRQPGREREQDQRQYEALQQEIRHLKPRVPQQARVHCGTAPTDAWNACSSALSRGITAEISAPVPMAAASPALSVGTSTGGISRSPFAPSTEPGKRATSASPPATTRTRYAMSAVTDAPLIVTTRWMRPRSMIATRSVSRSSSSRLCDAMMIARSARFSDATISRNFSVHTGSSPCVGSSKITTRVSISSACARPTRWKFPFESVWRLFLRCSPIASASITRFPSAVSRPPGTPASPASRRSAPSVVQCVGSAISSGTYATRNSSTKARGSMPSIESVPLVGRRNPSSSEMIVLFPAPFGPAMPSTSPGATSSVTSSTARTSRPSSERYVLDTPRNAIRAPSSGRG